MQRFRRWLMTSVDLIVSLLLGVLSLIYFAQVVFRYILNTPIIWADELSGFIFVWLSFLSCAVLLGEKAHVNIDILIGYLPDKIKSFFEWVSDLSILLISVILTYFGAQLVLGSMDLRTTILNLPCGAVYSIIPISSVLMLLILSIDLIMKAKRKKVDRKGEK